jgi:VanZ family protein
MFWFAFLYRRAPTRAAYAAGFVAMGVAIEFIQPFTGRDFEVADMLADALGVALGWGAARLLSRWLPRS